jgi:hypothetical protein
VGLGAVLEDYGKSHPPLGIDPRTLQPVPTGWAIPTAQIRVGG